MNMQKSDYEDIIGLVHHVSGVHPPMPVAVRAAQFAPFAALTGYGDVIRETARQTDPWTELTEDEKEVLNHKLYMALGKNREEAGEITIIYFVPDRSKEGGAYCRITGKAVRVDHERKEIIMQTGDRIRTDRVTDIIFSEPPAE